DLPGPTYAIGFVRAYAHYLGFDSERVLEVYKAESAEVHAKPDLSLPVPLGVRSLPGGPILLVGLILALCGDGTCCCLGAAAAKLAGQVEIKAVADCWIQVRGADQEIVFSRVLKAGETYQVPRSGLILRTGNAGALAILVDGKPAPSLGAVGALRRNVTLDP